MDKYILWFRTFPILGIIVAIIALVIVKKVLGKAGPSDSMNWIVIMLFGLIVVCVAAAAYGFKHIHPPDMKGQTWK